MKLKFKEISFLELGLNKNIRTGAGFNSSDFIDEGIPLIKIGNIKNNVIDLNDCSFVSAKYKTDAVVKEKDLLIAMRGATSGKLGLVSKESEGCYYVGSIGNLGPINENLIYFPFLKYLEEQLFEILKTKSKGTATPMVSIGMLKEFKLLIPESKEQQKYLCDVLELRKDKSNLIRKEITQQLDLIKQLRQAFLREAMQGRFEFPQQPLTEALEGNDLQTGQDLLAKIKAEKAQLIAEKKIKQGKLQEAEVLEDLLFDIPEHWVWCNLDDICFNITDGTHQTPQYTKTGRMFLSAQNVKPFKFKPENHKFVSEEDYQVYIKNRKPEKGDLLIGRVGAGIGETAVIDQDLDFCIYVSVALVQPFKVYINSDYLAQVFNSPYGVRYAKGNISSKGGSAGNFNLGRIRSFQIPLPPLHEQEQIVAKLEELMAFCDGLEQSIKESQGYNEQLLQQVLREALQGEEVNI